MKQSNPPFLRSRRGLFLLAMLVAITVAGTRSSFTTEVSTAAAFCTNDPVVVNNLDAGAGSLRQAIADACAGSTITFDMGMVVSPITLTSGELSISQNLTINGPGSSLLTVQRSAAEGTPDFRIFKINPGLTVSISALTMSNGRISGTFPGNYGGAIWNNHSTLNINNSIISGNSAVSVSPLGFGGGIFNDGADSGSATLTILNTQITGNSATGNGGGIFNYGSHGSATLTITGSTIANNSAQSAGGGILSSGQSGSAPMQITNSLISGNTAPIGGGINNEGTQNGSAPLKIANTTISGNNATVIGGGLVSQGTTNISGAPVTIINATITNNRSDSDDTTTGSAGGAMFLFTGPVTVHNSIIALNFRGSNGTEADNVFNVGFEPNSSFNLIGTTGTGGLVNGVNSNIVGVADPFIGPLANNGGPTQTHALLAASQAREAGSNCVLTDACSPALGFSLTTDQRGAGFIRAADSADANTTQTVDIGAFESQASIENIDDRSTPEDTSISFLFNVGDATAITSVTASSSNTGLVPNLPSNITVTGAGSSRNLNITPAANLFGTSTITVTVTSGSESASDTFVLTVTPLNDAPLDIALSSNTVADNSPGNTLVGTFSTIDMDGLDTFTYTLVSGAGSPDNASFAISGNQLRTAGIFDFETKPTYFIRVRSTDAGALFVEKQFTINVTDGPDNPGAISFSSATQSVGEAAGNANITLTRTGGTDNGVVAKVSLSDVTTSPADYTFAPGSLDLSFNSGTGATSGSSALPQSVQTVILQPDGKIIIGGAFLFYNDVPRIRMARINANGTLDTSFNPGAGPNAIVLCSALQADGKILIGGFFGSYDGIGRFRIARVNTDGTLDQTFATLPDDVVRSIVVQPDGKILIAGDFFLVNGISRNHVARLNTDGSLDFSFNAAGGSTGVVSKLALQPDGKVILAGGFISYGGANNTRIVRLESTGALDATFNSGMGISLAPHDVLLQPDGKIVVGGEFIGNDTPFGHQGIVRLETSGAIDPTFDPAVGTNGGTIEALALQPDSKIIAAGGFATYNGFTVNGIARLNSTGSLDTSFNANGGFNVPFPPRAVVVQPDGKIVTGGQYTFFAGGISNGFTRINGDLFVRWAPGDAANKSVQLPIVDDALDEPNETLSLQVTPLSGGATTGANPSSILTIVDNDPSATAVSAVSGTGVFGGTATVTATLTSNGANLSGKTISFTLNGNPVGSAATNVSGVASVSGLSLAGVNAGTYLGAVIASFTGDGVDFMSSGNAGALTVSKATTTTGVTSSVNPSDFGQSVTFTATVTSGAGTPSGSVQFKDGGTNIGSAQALTAGVAQLSISSLASGSHVITAEYSGDGNFLNSTGTLAGGQVVKSQPTLSVNDVSIAEGNSGTSNLVFTVTLSAASALTVNVNYATANGTATTSDNDYQSAASTLTFTPGQVTKTVTILVNGDRKFEPDEAFFLGLTTPVNTAISDAQGTGTIVNDDDLQLLLDESGPGANQAAAFDSMLFVRDPFHVLSVADWLDLGPDRNTRVTIFAANLTLGQGELPASVVVSLVDNNSQTFNIPAEDVRPVPNSNFTQVVFRLPDNLASGVCMVTIKAQGRTSNTATFRIAP